jgi:hypothetical protein
MNSLSLQQRLPPINGGPSALYWEIRCHRQYNRRFAFDMQPRHVGVIAPKEFTNRATLFISRLRKEDLRMQVSTVEVFTITMCMNPIVGLRATNAVASAVATELREAAFKPTSRYAL